MTSQTPLKRNRLYAYVYQPLVKLSSHSGGLLAALYFLLLPVVVASFVGHGAWIFLLYACCLFAVLYFRLWGKNMRERYIREAPIPKFLKTKLLRIHPHLTAKDADLVERGLRQFFIACALSNKDFVAMPSRAVDALWHEFILHTKAYEAWCDMALGRFLHHTPAAALGKKAKNNDGLRRAWYWACKDEAIDPKAPSRLPLLFALDLKLAIEGGFSYLPDCADIVRKNAAGGSGGAAYCGTDFSSNSYSSDSSSSGDFGGADTSNSTDSGGTDGGSDGGSGGGCGGGGSD